MTVSLLILVALQPPMAMADWPNSKPVPADPRETHLRNLRQLTFGGQNAEAYWDFSGKKLTYQSTQPEFPDEQIYVMNADGSNKTMISTGEGRCTCSYFTPDGKWVYFSSTHATSKGAQPKPDMSQGYVWPVNPRFAIYKTAPNGTGNVPTVLRRNGYIAETTIDPKGRRMFFTGSFDGDLEIYSAELNGKNIKRLTHEFGYDGGPFVSWDGKKIVYRRQTLATTEEKADYSRLLAQNLVRPGKLEIWIMDTNGRHKRQVTRLGAASFAPFLLPDGKRIIFSSNVGDPKGREFDLYLIGVNGKGLERVTYTKDFDGFPMITRDGKKLVFASNRFGSVPRETNIFVADWAEPRRR